MEDLTNFDSKLTEAIRFRPNEYLDIFEEACVEVYKVSMPDEFGLPPAFQVQINSFENPRMLRNLQSS
jgi:DNA replicative helicase MCM subunit Mcm2 (Cdc46/Mcm family)